MTDERGTCIYSGYKLPSGAAVLADFCPRGDFAPRASPGGAGTLPRGAPATNKLLNKALVKKERLESTKSCQELIGGPAGRLFVAYPDHIHVPVEVQKGCGFIEMMSWVAKTYQASVQKAQGLVFPL